MNGDHSTVVEFAQRAHEAAERSATHALRADQAMGRMERELAEIRREMRKGFEALSAVIMAPQRREMHSITEDDFEISDTGTHAKVTIDTVEKILKRKAVNTDARRWRKALDLSGKIALRVVGLALAVFIGWLAHRWGLK